MNTQVIAIRNGIYIPNVSPVILDALARFVTVLCDGAFDTEGDDAHDDVIALAYVMPPEATHDWGAWPDMIRDWYFPNWRFPETGGIPRAQESILQVADVGTLREFWARFGSDPVFAADLVAGAIADGFDDDLLLLAYWDHKSKRDVLDREALNCLISLAALSPKHGWRLRETCEVELARENVRALAAMEAA